MTFHNGGRHSAESRRKPWEGHDLKEPAESCGDLLATAREAKNVWTVKEAGPVDRLWIFLKEPIINIAETEEFRNTPFGLHIYMVGQSEITSSPTIIFSSPSVQGCRKFIRAVRQTGILRGYPQIKLGSTSSPTPLRSNGTGSRPPLSSPQASSTSTESESQNPSGSPHANPKLLSSREGYSLDSTGTGNQDAKGSGTVSGPAFVIPQCPQERSPKMEFPKERAPKVECLTVSLTNRLQKLTTRCSSISERSSRNELNIFCSEYSSPATSTQFSGDMHAVQFGQTAEQCHDAGSFPPFQESVGSGGSEFDSASEYESTSECGCSEDSSPLDPDDPVQQEMGAIVNKLLTAFSSPNRAHTPHHGESGRGPETRSSLSYSNPGPSYQPHKRKPESNGPDEQNGEDGTAGIATKKRKIDHLPKQLLACPFFKMDPIAWADCHKDTLKEIKRVKEHLYRKHMKPRRCPRCQEKFPKVSPYNAHVREGKCGLREEAVDVGIDEDQKMRLHKRAPKGTDEKRQWYLIWEIAFPLIPPPESPYLDAILREQLLGFQERIRNRGPPLILRHLRGAGHDIGSLTEDQLRNAVSAATAELSREMHEQSTGRLPEAEPEPEPEPEPMALPTLAFSPADSSLTPTTPLQLEPTGHLSAGGGEMGAHGPGVDDYGFGHAGNTYSLGFEVGASNASLPDQLQQTWALGGW
ncbi:hypothetical protein MKZ38_007222 [Zalerion maritima]|uniref:C2H2-type domain-containing protein n=1 Tax=Zalerion maritima TaxID=339359 RepID=A0AAD5RJ48_9PEZI|nr:hypothetical protein MKZ38_007222 [Zalerion maritima]